MVSSIALIPTDLTRSRLGLASLVARLLAGAPVLAHTVRRVSQVAAIERIVLVHPAGQDPLALLEGQSWGKPIDAFADPQGLMDPYLAWRQTARKWAVAAWRGGLGGATCYDELLPAGPLRAALQHYGADSALLVGADWALVDPAWCQKVLALHLENPQAMQLTFTQAPPGLAGIAISTNLVGQLADSPGATIGQIMGYNPARPQADPIGRDVCVQVPGPLRSCTARLIYDTPRTVELIDAVVGRLGSRLTDVGAEEVAVEATRILSTGGGPLGRLPQQITLELTSVRAVNGPIVPQHHVHIGRQPMPLAQAREMIAEIGQLGRDVALTLGGLGDALLYDQWEEVVLAAREAGIWGVALETDLLVDEPVIHRLLASPIDLLSVRLNADCARTYQEVMGRDGFAQVTDNLQRLIVARNARDREHLDSVQGVLGGAGLPWVMPRMVKTAATFPDMEGFFDRWVYFAGHALIEPATTGQGPEGALMPAQSPVPMAPPRRIACRQIANRMSIHSDGSVALCNQDWLYQNGNGSAGKSLSECWAAMEPARAAQREGRWMDLPLCARCTEWHRP